MLNPLLYQKLKEIFGDVDISREDDLGEIIKPQGGGVHSVKWGERYNVECPICEDEHKKRLGISYLSGQTARFPGRKQPIAFSYNFRCVHKECQRGKSLWSFLKKSGIWDLGVVNIGQKVSISSGKKFANKPEVDIPKKSRPINHPKVPAHVTDYLRERGFDPDELGHEFDVKWQPAHTSWKVPENLRKDPSHDTWEFFHDKILIPIVGRRKLVGWQVRKVSEDDPYSKYITAPGTDLSSVLYNMDNAKYSRGLIITEGVADVWSASKAFEQRDKDGEKYKPVNSVALFGKGFDNERLRILSNIWGSELDWGCLMLDGVEKDPDAPVTASRIAQDLEKHEVFPGGFGIAYINNGDPGDHTVEQIEDLVQEAEQWW